MRSARISSADEVLAALPCFWLPLPPFCWPPPPFCLPPPLAFSGACFSPEGALVHSGARGVQAGVTHMRPLMQSLVGGGAMQACLALRPMPLPATRGSGGSSAACLHQRGPGPLHAPASHGHRASPGTHSVDAAVQETWMLLPRMLPCPRRARRLTGAPPIMAALSNGPFSICIAGSQVPHTRGGLLDTSSRKLPVTESHENVQCTSKIIMSH